ncbi:YbhB/YbcL family Raf kinase inhibitor-like protein [Chromohalobacter sp. TMW 2.2308]|uniref:YbhB/YbcL family Raf kinase inhibitor-like protein n=1 Tax=Chromohalobacter moromii TaxID=2860329 RepID=A0A9X2X516_9GAMM|nr:MULTISPECIES: YbhB/YbcL family Raf kinase inhibitor-like protein [Chromohalobacter]MCK2041233.1 YbhB/YbcL family Raf kinase inhibitor-like protein [Chromohalobacter moromii]MCK2046862.1 YbhB/YbcL family Raf kinase inhibitor-like protein [Chromohalobacter moromii]MCT8506439.1 YbhB/YbcL family Raf kinase inhibitor-like protein [Chromohalobacter moromii]MCT8513381.1 YbhB/YbcL family Raf kinase inhibitor-like protein [Chromohalobacter sp. TMW 2.2271]
MRIDVQDIIDGEPIPERFAFAVPDPEQHLRFSDNRNPHVHWHDVPAGTRSLALLVVDVDAPTDPSDVNQEGRSVSADLPRADFYHWVLIDIPVEVSGIDEGEDADGVVAMGKAPGETGKGVRGINSYTDFFIDDEQLEGIYGGYDGPCPPWNDARVHRYHFTIYALDVASLGLQGEFTGDEVLEAMQGRVLEQSSVMGTYTLNPELAR